MQRQDLQGKPGPADRDSRPPGPLRRQIPQEPRIQRTPHWHDMRGAVLDDIGGSERDGGGNGGQPRGQAIHGSITRAWQSA
jgi:hypothetical protein